MLDTLGNILLEIWFVLLEASPWLVVGLLFAGLVRSFLPEGVLTRLIGGSGVGGVVKAAIVGAPLPLCSCGVLPTAIGLRRQGLSRPATVSFLIATPQNGVDSLAISYSMLGLPFTIARLVCSLISAVFAGVVTWLWVPDSHAVLPADEAAQDAPSCCSSRNVQPAPQEASCCGVVSDPSCCDEAATGAIPGDSRGESLLSGQRYAFGKLYSDLSGLLMLGIVVAGVINAFVSPASLSEFGSGLGVMLLILVVSVPMYICATASTPVAASMLLAGVSPGGVLVFLLAGPATNVAGIVLIRREIGTRATAAYLTGLIGSAVGLGLLLDAFAGSLGLMSATAEGSGGMMVPHWAAVASAMLLVGLLIWQKTARLRAESPAGRPVRETSLQSPTAVSSS